MATFTITTNEGEIHTIESDLKTALQILSDYGKGAVLEILHPGTSGHGTAGIDF